MNTYKVNVGIDISKEYHIVHFRLLNKKYKPFRVENNMKGLEILEEKLSCFRKEDILIGMESTGHYWKHFGKKLREHNYNLQIVNAYHVKRYKEIEDNTPNKNDNKDSKIISKLLSDGKGLHANIYDDGEIYSSIKVLYESRLRLIEDLKHEKVLIRTLIERYFPEYEHFFKSGIWIKSSVALLSEIGLSGFTEDNLLHIDNILIKSSKHRFKEGIGKQLVSLYNNSLGLKSGLNESELEFRYRLSKLKSCQEEIKKIDKKLFYYLNQLDEWEYLRSIPGVGIVLGSGLISELGNIRKYKRRDSIIKLAGLNLTSNSSGKSQGKYTISRRGRSNLRSIAYMISLHLVRLDKNVNNFYNSLLSKGKSSIGSLIKIGCKCLSMLRHLVINREYYNSDLFLSSSKLNNNVC